MLAADGVADRPVLILGVDDVNLGPKQQRAERLELAGVGLARARLGEDDLVGVLQLPAEGVEDDERAGLGHYAIEDAVRHREAAGSEREGCRQAARVEGAVARQAIAHFGQAGGKAEVVLERCGPAPELEVVERDMEARAALVERPARAAADQQIEREAEDVLVAALECVPQPAHLGAPALPLRALPPPPPLPPHAPG